MSTPPDGGLKLSLARALARFFCSKGECMFWATTWSVWDLDWMPLFERVRLSYGDSSSISEKPGILFTEEEETELTTFVLISLLFLWDIRIISASDCSVAETSHDEFWTLTTEDASGLLSFASELQEHGFDDAASKIEGK